MAAAGVLFLVATILSGTVAAAGIVLYATDYAVEATITDLQCGFKPGSGSGGILTRAEATATLKTKMFGVERTVGIPSKACTQLDEGNFVERHIRTGRTILYDREGGGCVYDTASGFC